MAPPSSERSPSRNDVMCGRGGLSNKHPGNRLFRRLVKANKEIYHRTINPAHKQMLVLSVIEAIRGQGGRFVKKERADWVEITRQDANIKTSQALREHLLEIQHSPESSSSRSWASSSRALKAAKKQRQPKAELQPILQSEYSIPTSVESQIPLSHSEFPRNLLTALVDEFDRSEDSVAEVSVHEDDLELIRLTEPTENLTVDVWEPIKLGATHMSITGLDEFLAFTIPAAAATLFEDFVTI